MKKDEKIILDELLEAVSAMKAELSRLEGLALELASKPLETNLSDAEPAIVAMAEEKPRPRMAVVDAMLADEAWRTDIPSSEVKDIRSAIALNDRILVINKLFVGDAEDFQRTVAALNEMSSFGEAVDFLKGRYPDWKWNSDIVYRFMMAVRRKLR